MEIDRLHTIWTVEHTDPEVIKEQTAEAIGLFLVFVADYASRRGLGLDEIVDVVWSQYLKKRRIKTLEPSMDLLLRELDRS